MHAGISVDGLGRTYRPRRRPPVRALHDVSFDVRPGEVVSLLGPNGAGKTTCVRILATLLTPTAGRATVGGEDVVARSRNVRSLCGVSFGGDLGLYTRLSARDNLRYFGTMYRLDPRLVETRIDELLSIVGLTDRANDKVENFSRGMRQRLHLARAVLHDPPVLLLDEPSAGLDPQGSRDLRKLVKELAAQDRAILITTHDLAEAEAVSTRILILSAGTVLRQATAAELRQEATGRFGTCIEVQGAEGNPADLVEGLPGLIRWTAEVGVFRLYTSAPDETVSALLSWVREHEASIQITKPTLEEAYLSLVEEA